MSNSRRVLVTGAGGFIGANLVRRLAQDGHEVHSVERPGGDEWRLLGVGPGVTRHLVDLLDGERVRDLVQSVSPEWVFHLAAYGAYPFQRSLSMAIETNVVGTLNLACAALDAGCRSFISAGSSSEYGIKDHAPLEEEAIEPNSSYAVAKASATLLLRHLGRSTGRKLVTLRLYSAYGPFEEPTRLVPALVLSGLKGRLPPLVQPAISRDFVHVDDVVTAFLLAAEGEVEPGAVLNVGTGRQTSLAEAVEVARAVLGVGEAPLWGSMADRHWDTTVWVANSDRIRRLLGWRPKYSFCEGFRSTVNWFRERPEMVSLYERRKVEGASGDRERG